MAPKKEKNKDGQTNKVVAYPEAEKEFYLLQIADLNQKVARLRATLNEYEVQNNELQKAYDKLDVDRADIIAYLKKTLNAKNEENNELKEKVNFLEDTREKEIALFKVKFAESEKNFAFMKNQLTSEKKLLTSKLNTLEEFRAIKDDLMERFETQENNYENQKLKYKRIIYDTEKKFIIGKDKLKKEMEARLLQLAQDFQDSTEMRIAASTHRIIRENIAINSELDKILSNQARLSDLNVKYKESENVARVTMELAEEERDKAINKNIVLLKVIKEVTDAYQKVKEEQVLYEKGNYDFEALQAKIQKLTQENKEHLLQNRILEQNLHVKMSAKNKSYVEASKIATENSKLKKILKQAATSVKAALKLDQWATKDPDREIMDRQDLLQGLLDILVQYQELQRTESIDTIASFGKVYEEGDLGFIPKRSTQTFDKSKDHIFLSAMSVGQTDKKYSTESMSTSSTSLSSLKTIPSMKVLPYLSDEELSAKVSLPSFVKSTASTESSRSEEHELGKVNLTEIEKQLAASKLEIKASIMQDLLLLNIKSISMMSLNKEESITKCRSEIVIETTTLDEEKNETRENGGERGELQDIGETDNDNKKEKKVNEEIDRDGHKLDENINTDETMEPMKVDNKNEGTNEETSSN